MLRALVVLALVSLPLVLAAPPAEPELAAAGPCGTGEAVTATHGAGPSNLAFAALKTGTRAVVAWTTEERVQASLTFNLSGAYVQVLREATPRTDHVFVVDGLPRHEAFCFQTSTGESGALRLRNAMYAHDGEAYVLNLLVLANEQPDGARLETGIDNFAWRLHDSTDGHVKAGSILVVYGDYERHNSGWVTCYLPQVSHPGCRASWDVIFTADATPLGAASTYRDGIRNARQAIWMNSYHQAGLVSTGDDVGAVLNHEIGHYVFGGLDLYVGSGCDVVAKGLSVMSSNRALTEYDDEINRCPNEREVAGYVPTWTLIRERFPLVPDRAGVINPGPTTAGDAYERHVYAPLPLASRAPDLAHDDAGSGRDAPNRPDPTFTIVPGVVYTGHAVGTDRLDHYAFHAEAGQTVTLAFTGVPACYSTIAGADNAPLTRTCTVGTDGAVRLTATIPSTGTWYARLQGPGPYRFVVTLDAPAPAPLP